MSATTQNWDAIENAVRTGGINPDHLIPLGYYVTTPEPRHIDYLDLTPCQNTDDEILPDAVIESNTVPVMYLIRRSLLGGDRELNPDQFSDIMKTLASRGDARLLGVVSESHVDVYPIEFRGKDQWGIPKNLKHGSLRLREFLTTNDMRIETPQVDSNNDKNSDVWLRQTGTAWLECLLFRLLDTAATQIKTAAATSNSRLLSDSDILSLIGRALFIRFLVDRNIVARGKIILGDEANVARAFAWLDDTFNGDLLPLGGGSGHQNEAYYLNYFHGLNPSVKIHIFYQLCNILDGTHRGQMELFWDDIKFRHVPADLLSQVYEHFYRKYEIRKSKETSIHYTPRRLADLTLDGCFNAMETGIEKYKAKILDPSAGGGVFLSLALRRLVRERWLKSNRRPKREALHNILENQIFGFDVNKDALKMAALGLYLTVLELDPEPVPPDKRPFAPLLKRNLFVFDETACGDDLGSLSECIESLAFPGTRLLAGLRSFTGTFDIVVGNPPWTAWSGVRGTRLTGVVQRVMERRTDVIFTKQEIAAYASHNYNPDTPFVWRAIEWAKKGGGIGFLLHSRLLYQPKIGDSWTEREYLFRAIKITGVVDGSRIRTVKEIWPGNTAPFILLVAKNRRPDVGAAFHFLSLHKEKKLNKAGRFRIDEQSLHPIRLSHALDTPHLLKTLMRGSALDADFISRLEKRAQSTLGTFLNNHKIELHRGFQPPTKDGKGDQDATDMFGLPILDAPQLNNNQFSYNVNTNVLKLSRYQKVSVAGKIHWYKGPLLLFRQKAAVNRAEQGALYCDNDLFFNFSFYGISLRNIPDNRFLARYLTVLSYSSLFAYYSLMAASKYGIEREAFHVEDYERFPFILPKRVRRKQKTRIDCHRPL